MTVVLYKSMTLKTNLGQIESMCNDSTLGTASVYSAKYCFSVVGLHCHKRQVCKVLAALGWPLPGQEIQEGTMSNC